MIFYAVIILYNKAVYDSLSVKTLSSLNDEDLKIIVMDNSNSEFIQCNTDWSSQNDITYIPMNGNAGLSKAYNRALIYLKEMDQNNLVIWFDDDTPISKEYLGTLKKVSRNPQYDVFVPIIYGQNGIIYSPCKTGLFKGQYIKTPDQKISADRFNAINSCLAVRLKVYKDYHYDESLFMDCVDTKLFDDFRKMKLSFYILPVIIYQNFFQRETEKTIEKYWNRFKIRIVDTVTYGNINRKKSWVSIVRIVGWAAVYGIKMRSIKFFIDCLLLGIRTGIQQRSGRKKYEN